MVPPDDAAPARLGRPRRQDRAAGDPRADILAAAGRLFARQGVAGTSMAQVAAAAGLQPSSVYYYFRAKQEILHELVADANRVPLEVVAQVNAEGGTAAVRLWRLIRRDVIALCHFPYDINEVHRISAQDPDAMATYWRDRQRLADAVEAIVAEGVHCGELREVDARITALTVLSNDEGAQNWYRPIGGRRATGRAGRAGRGRYRAEEVGEFLADLVLRGLLSRPSRLAAVRRRAARLDG